MGLSQAEKYIPGARWLRGYTAQYAVADLIAGITVGLTVLPQGLAYATLAGLEPQVSALRFKIHRFLQRVLFVANTRSVQVEGADRSI